jgi:penicillin amidase
MKFLKCLWSVVVAIALIYFFDKPLGVVPPLGKFFSPFHGFLQNTTGNEELSEEIFLTGVTDEVKVVYDKNYVPHVFANNEEDLYFAQGYLVAMDRLWQMEFYTLVSSGRLTEVVGETAFEYDRYNRRLGMARAAAEITENQKKDPAAWKIMMAYTNGVNAYISQLKYKDLPIEYKILGYEPAEWTPYKTILMLMKIRFRDRKRFISGLSFGRISDYSCRNKMEFYNGNRKDTFGYFTANAKRSYFGIY